ncbi:peptidyl-prolyl cis-trans isomerase [Phenylobacterium sp.]|uniref:peptidylprolyl isomerase n=1 Tax=Phenylobacterium sp. TaxID=1871053 RepID=UPI0035ADB575
MRSILARVAREPLTHFLLVGAILFLGATVGKAAHRPVIRVDTQELNQLADYWQLQMQRPPTKAELDGLIRERVDEEILAREARRLGLDQDDIIIRRRLAQKMAFAGEDAEPIAEPSEAALRAFYEQTKADYRAPATVALRHVYFSADRPGRDAEAAARRALDAAKTGAAPTGDPFVLPLSYADARIADLARDYGPDFAKAVAAAPVGVWSGPVKSAYGWHLVRVDQRTEAAVESFEQARGEVRDAWLAKARQAANAAFLGRLRARYRVVVADDGGA